eukprot:Amastigsp_a511349_22.p2 type:complete len:361 gc:universal Amastigsp_a511349_22:1158-76(-)
MRRVRRPDARVDAHRVEQRADGQILPSVHPQKRRRLAVHDGLHRGNQLPEERADAKARGGDIEEPRVCKPRRGGDGVLEDRRGDAGRHAHAVAVARGELVVDIDVERVLCRSDLGLGAESKGFEERGGERRCGVHLREPLGALLLRRNERVERRAVAVVRRHVLVDGVHRVHGERGVDGLVHPARVLGIKALELGLHRLVAARDVVVPRPNRLGVVGLGQEPVVVHVQLAEVGADHVVLLVPDRRQLAERAVAVEHIAAVELQLAEDLPTEVDLFVRAHADVVDRVEVAEPERLVPGEADDGRAVAVTEHNLHKRELPAGRAHVRGPVAALDPRAHRRVRPAVRQRIRRCCFGRDSRDER